jgi:DNA-binding MarR family transcriptional regulator
MRWQRAVDRALAPLDLTHSQYWVLQTTRYLQEEVHNDAVSQQQIADAAQLDKATTSYLCRKLEAKGLLDRGDTHDDRRAWRVIVTSKARRLLAKAGPMVAQLARKS